MQTQGSARPFLKWAGGKQQLLPQFAALYPTEFKRYFEPFIGSGAVFFDVHECFAPKKAYLTDNNAELVETYAAVRDDVDSLIRRLRTHKTRHHVDLPGHYYRVRDQDTARLDAVGRAARLIYLNKTCYNGLYRVNGNGRFNVPVGSYKDPPVCDPDLLRAASAALQRASLRATDFESATRSAGNGDFVYFDPPYYPLSRTANFTGYTNAGFDEEQQRRLAGCFRDLDRRGALVMLSNSDTKFIRDLYTGFRVETVQARRPINSNGRRRGAVREVVVLNY